MSKNEAGINLILVRFEDWTQPADQAEIERNARDFIRALTAVGQPRTRILDLCPTAPDNRRWEDFLVSELAAVDGLTIIGSSDITARYPVSRIQDPHAQEIGRVLIPRSALSR